ncbi:hypothetical protein LCGC14_2107940 [marine sediment metagenome]|uniref:Uncharacterized protein n=1 Tax=marine sediment metagenome TaxID=412755 RepID=A0A0F9EV51_9ZZZZ
MSLENDEIEPHEIVADALFDIAKSLRLLGSGNIDRGDNAVGAIESLSISIKEGSEKVSEALNGIADAIAQTTTGHSK